MLAVKKPKKRSAAFAFGRNTAGAFAAIAARPRGMGTGRSSVFIVPATGLTAGGQGLRSVSYFASRRPDRAQGPWLRSYRRRRQDEVPQVAVDLPRRPNARR